MSGVVAVVADSHLGGPGGEAQPLIEQLDRVVDQGCRHLVLLGDIFQVWVGRAQFVTPEIEALVPVLRRLRAGGVRIDYVEGNRDFFLAGGPWADCFDSIELETSFEVGGRRYLCVHGDGLNDRDRQYLFWRFLSKSLLSRFLITRLPGALARRAVGSTERQLSRTNFKHKSNLPEEAIVRYGRRRLAEGWDVLLLGHFHEPRTWRVEEGEIRLLDAWFNDRTVVVFD
ncbi:MAG: UDP-2,3-diacylglucosamine diphosphatase [Acidobacteriota bacterium]